MDDSKKMILARFRAIVEAYGADAALWPASERNQAKAFLMKNLAAQKIREGGARLDATLNVLPAPEAADAALIKRMATIPHLERKSASGNPAQTTFGDFLKGLFPARAFVPQGLGLALAGALGIWLGVNSGIPANETIVQINPAQYFLENPDLTKDLKEFE